MNKSDKIIAASAMAGLDMAVGEKETKTEGNVTTVSIYGKPCLILERNRSEVTICEDTICSRKSSRLINTVLELTAGARVENHNGRWFLKKTEKSRLDEMPRDVVIPTKKGILIQ